MKRFSKSASVLSSLLLVAMLCQPFHAAELFPSAPPAAEPDFSVSPSPSAPAPAPAPADDPLLSLLYSCINKGERFILFETKDYLSSEYLDQLMIELIDNTPDFFYLDQIVVTYTVNKNPDGTLSSCTYQFTPVYNLPSQEDILAAKTEWEGLLSDILQTVTPSMSDFEKALFLHDYLCTHFQYDSTLTIRDSYRFLTEKTGICEAYAGTYSALLDRLNIPNQFAVSTEMNHIWNVIQIGGEWYHVDITWDDPTLDQPGKAKHDAFLRSDKGIASLGHTNWVCEVQCTSPRYDASPLIEVNSAFVTDGTHLYGVSSKQNAIMRYTINTALPNGNITAQPLVDLSEHLWMVWDAPYYWNACFTNLYCDGEWLYYSLPDGIEALDLTDGTIKQISTYDKGDGYLYAMRYENHQLICTVSTAPASAESEFAVPTRHRYDPTAVEGIFATYACIDCNESRHSIKPPEGNVFAVAASSRPTPELEGAHDIRISLAFDRAAVAPLGAIEYRFDLNRKDGSTNTLLLHSENDEFGEFQIYEQLSAGERVYAPADNDLLTGFFIRAVEDNSWNSMSFTISQPATQTILHNGSLTYDQLITS